MYRTFERGTANVIGAVLHFMMGAIFAIIYAWLWANVVGDPVWWWGLIFGAVHGIIVIILTILSIPPTWLEIALLHYWI